MTTLLLIIIYIAFVSLGLPDSVLGAAWPTIYQEINVPVSYVGIVSMIIAGGTIVSSLFSNKLMQKLRTGMIVALSTALTAVALLGFSFSHSFWQLCLWGIPYGFGAGSIDAVLNHYVALHYKSRHMSWLHCFWGVGATVGPYIMGLYLTNHWGWNSAYRTIGSVQVVLAALLFISSPLWKGAKNASASESAPSNVRIMDAIRVPGVKAVLVAFFCYCALETTAGMWASSYLVLGKGIGADTAAKWTALFFIGISVGRFLCGFVTDKLGDRTMERIGYSTMLLGAVVLLIPFGNAASFAGLILIGFGCAPIYPSVIHATPIHFGRDNSQALIGMQMAGAYVGSTFMPPVFGLIADYINVALYPAYLLMFIVLMIVMLEISNREVQRGIKR